MKNLLIFCNNTKDVKVIQKLDLSIHSNIVIASDNYEVHNLCKKLNVIDKVIFLQKPLPYTKVYKSVIEITEKINTYLEKVAALRIFDTKELFWTHHVEGGYTTQRVQDTLLAIDSADLILREHSITEVLILGSCNLLEIKVLKKIAHRNGCKVSSNKQLPVLDNNKLKDLIRPIYLLLRSFVCKIISKRPKNFKINNLVLFQICGSSDKHIQNALFPQDNFLKNGFTPVNIIWGSTKEVKKINDMGHKAISIEAYLKFRDIFQSLIKTLMVFFKIKTIKKLFFKDNTFFYNDVDITDMVYGSVIQYLLTDGPENFRYRVAAERFVLEYSESIIAIKYCAAKFLSQGTILSNIFEDKYIKFDYEVGSTGPSLYGKYNSGKHHDFFSKNFIKFAPNEISKQFFIEYENISEDNSVIFGAGRANSHFNKARNLIKSDSHRELGIEKKYDMYILLEYSGSLSGYISLEELIIILHTLTNFVKSHQNIALIIKPHPSANLSPLSGIISNKTDNIYILDKKMSPTHALNIADVIITKFSYMGIEAMIYDVQVVSVLLDNEDIFRIFGEAAEYIYSEEELITFLDKTLCCKNSFDEWKNLFKEKRKQFIKEFFPILENSSEEIIVKKITNKINGK